MGCGSSSPAAATPPAAINETEVAAAAAKAKIEQEAEKKKQAELAEKLKKEQDAGAAATAAEKAKKEQDAGATAAEKAKKEQDAGATAAEKAKKEQEEAEKKKKAEADEKTKNDQDKIKKAQDDKRRQSQTLNAKYAKWAKLTQPNNENIILAATVTKKSANSLVGFQTRELVLTSAPHLIYGILGEDTKQKGVIPLTEAPVCTKTGDDSFSVMVSNPQPRTYEFKTIKTEADYISPDQWISAIRENSSKPQAKK